MNSTSINNYQERFSEILKKKGIGPEGSKSLKVGQIEEVKFLLQQNDVSITTKATFLTALYTLNPNEAESEFIQEINESPEKFLSTELIEFLTNKEGDPFLKIIKKVISNSDLDERECRDAMKFFLDENQPDYLKSAFLEAERLKRETFLENSIFFEALWSEVDHHEINSEILIDIADSYDGSNRTRNFSVFVAALLASSGFQVYLHGIDSVAPKEGVTSHQILKAARKNPLKGASAVIQDIQNPEIGWGYIDQKIFFPKLYKLKKMRKDMVKRPFLATFEKLLQPIKATGGNVIVTGYTHAHYKEELVKQLQFQKQCKQVLVLKGVEGSTQVSMSRGTVGIHYNGYDILEYNIFPEEYGFSTYSVPRDMSINPENSLKEGIEALKGVNGFAKDNILYTAALILDKLGLMQKNSIVNLLNACVESGRALNHWEKGNL